MTRELRARGSLGALLMLAGCLSPTCEPTFHVEGVYRLEAPDSLADQYPELAWMKDVTLQRSPGDAEVMVEVVVDGKRYRAVYTYEALDPGLTAM